MREKIIFLDVDFVLNGEHTKESIGRITGIDPEKVKLLKKIVDYSHAKIVLSSSWREYWDPNDKVKNWTGSSPKRYGRYLNAKLAESGLSIYDKTEEIAWTKRALEIQQWIAKHRPKSYVILDDEDFSWKFYGLDEHWVDTTEVDGWRLSLEGLTEYHVEKAKEILEKEGSEID